MARVFLSYSSTDKPAVLGLVDDLEALGHTAWMDQQLTGGQSWWDHILEEIRGCEVFITVLTNSFLTSGACQSEYRYAKALGKTLLPVRLADEIDMDRIPPELQMRQIVNYGAGVKSGVLSLHKALVGLEPSGALPDPLPAPPPVPISYAARILDEIIQPEVLSYDEQIAIVFRLRDHFRETGNAVDVRKALDALAKRRDLYARVKEEMAAVLAEAEPIPSEPTPAEPTPVRPTPEPPTPPVESAPVRPRLEPERPAAPRIEDRPPAPEPVTLIHPDRPGQPHVPTPRRPEKPAAEVEDKGSIPFAILSFFVPLVGFILYAVWRNDKPKSAKQAGIAAVAGFILYLMLYGDGSAYY